MIDQGLDPDEQVAGERPIHVAAKTLSAGVAQALVEGGASIHFRSASSETPLMMALLSCARPYLRKQGLGHVMGWPEEFPYICGFSYPSIDSFGYCGYPDFHRSGSRPTQQCLTIVRLLLMARAKADADECASGKPLHVACAIGNTAIVQALIDSGADVNAVSGYFETPLFAVMEARHLDTASLLLGANAHDCP